MSNSCDPRFRPMAMWRWHPGASVDDHLFALDQAARQGLGGLVVAHDAAAPPEVFAEVIAAGAERGLMMWHELPPPATGIDPLHPGEVMHLIETEWAPVLIPQGIPHPGLSGVILPAARPPMPTPGGAWSPVFPEAFLDQKGYVPDASQAGHAHVRADLYDVYTTLLAAAWYGATGEWCDEYGLTLIACVAEGNATDAGALAKYTAEIDIPAIRVPLHDLNRHACMAVHAAATIALRPRTAAILDHGPLHVYSLDTLKATADTLCTAGIDLIVVDGFGGSLDACTGLSYQMPQWPHVHRWSRYTGIRCGSLRDERASAPVALLDPGLSIAAAGDPAPVAEEFQAVREALDSEQIGYVTLDEPTCTRLVAVEGRLFVRGLWFDALIVPPVTHLRETTMAALRRLASEARVFVVGTYNAEVLPAAGQARHVSMRSIEGAMHAYSVQFLRSHFLKHAFPQRVVGENSPSAPEQEGGIIRMAATWHFTPHDGNAVPIEQWPFEAVIAESIANVRIELAGDEPVSAVRLDGVPLERDARVFRVPGRLGAGPHRFDVEADAKIPTGAWFRGDFTIHSESPLTVGPVRGVETGPWEARGFPYFSGTGTYVGEIEVPRENVGLPCDLVLPDVRGTVEVEVNGHTVEVLAWPPYRVAVTQWLRAGSNLITLSVSNTLANRFDGPDRAYPSGLVEAPYLQFDARSQSE